MTLDDQVETSRERRRKVEKRGGKERKAKESRETRRKVEKSRGKKGEEMRLPLFRMSAKSIIPVIGCSAAPSSTNR